MKSSKPNFKTLVSKLEYLNVNKQGLLKGGYLVLNHSTFKIDGPVNGFCAGPNIVCGSKPPKK
jgi:hypothetical protein